MGRNPLQTFPEAQGNTYNSFEEVSVTPISKSEKAILKKEKACGTHL